MTSVRGPFVFTSDVWRDEYVTLAVRGHCGAVALQLGVAPTSAAGKVRDAGLQVIGWGSCSQETRAQLDLMRPTVWMPQAETSAEFEALIACLPAPFSIVCEPVMTSGGMETEKPNPSDAEKTTEVKRRRTLLHSFGVDVVWVETYAQDADRAGQPWLGDVQHMCEQFTGPYGFEEAHPVIGLWNDYSLSRYDLSHHGRNFAAWRAEQMTNMRYDEIASWVASLEVDIAGNRTQALTELSSSIAAWRRKAMPEESIALQRQTLAWRVLNVVQSGTNVRALRDALDQAGAPKP